MLSAPEPPACCLKVNSSRRGPYNLPYDVTADGKRFVMLQRVGASDGEADRTHLTFIFNWFDEVCRRVAAAGQN